MFHQKEPHELALASTAILLHLLHRLIHDRLLKRDAARRILSGAADALISNPVEATEAHYKASNWIREELVPKVGRRPVEQRAKPMEVPPDRPVCPRSSPVEKRRP
jgi:hypothetical protein